MTEPEPTTEIPGLVRVWPSKRLVNILDLDPDTIELPDIAHGLDRICRYNGHVAGFLSVAEHSLHVVHLLDVEGAPIHVLRQGLLHDAAEAYLGDMVGPVKHLPEMAAYREIEQRIEEAIAHRFDLPFPFDPWVKGSPSAGGTVKRFLSMASRLGVA